MRALLGIQGIAAAAMGLIPGHYAEAMSDDKFTSPTSGSISSRGHLVCWNRCNQCQGHFYFSMNNSKKVSSNVVSGSMGVTWAAWSEDWSLLISIPKPIETVIEKLLTHLENEKKTFELLLMFFSIHLSCWQVSATDARIWGIWTPDQLDYGVAMCQKIP